jgi:hypothetical protein
MESSRRYRVGISVFCPTVMVPTFGIPECQAVLIFLASLRTANFAASCVAKPPSRFRRVLLELRIS